MRRAWLLVRIWRVRVLRLWYRGDRRYGWWWRAGNFALAVLMLAGVIMPVVQSLLHDNSYKLSADALKLVGQTDKSLAKQLTYDAQTATYQFNKTAVNSDDGSNPLAKLKAQVGTASGKGSDKSLYALDVPADFSKGVTYHDTNSQLSFSLVPQFSATAGKNVNGHLVFPLHGDNQAVYTLKNNGLKEDIVVPKTTQDTMTFSYDLKLPKTLEAKVIPNSGGNVGIYSADPSLFGDISYGSDADRASVAKARETAPKTYLVFGLPSPVIKTTSGKQVGNARFELAGNTLSVIASGIANQNNPITIDPSVVVTSTSDFQADGNNEGNIDFGTTGQVTRSGLTGGTYSSGWSVTGGSLINYAMGEVAYNGYLYQIDGFQNGLAPNAFYAAINPVDGTLGSWTTTSTPSTGRVGTQAVAYNGYMYVYGGWISGTSALSSVEYAPINSDGSLGTWQTSANAMALGVCRFGAAVYNGYIYATAGANVANGQCGNASTPTNTVQYAPLNADGSVGTWVNSANTFTTARQGPETVAYNGYLYVMGGGSINQTTNYHDVQYAPLNADGSVGTWITTAIPMFKGRTFGAVAVYNGYMYIFAGIEENVGGVVTTIYAPINANGSTGNWNYGTTLTGSDTYRALNGGAVYNGYLYASGGSTGGGPVNSDTQVAKIDSAGMPNAYFTNSTTFTSNRRGGRTVAYNGYLYEMGGDAGGAPVATIYSAPLNADGSVGTFSANGSFTTAREYFSAIAYNGYMFVIGGCTIAYGTCTGGSGNNATVYSAPITASTGALGSWTAQTNLPAALYGSTAVTYNNVIYVLGGTTGAAFTSAIYYHSLTNGTISGAWSTSARTLPAASAYVSAALYGSTLFVAGGCTAGVTTCTTTTASVYYAPITSGGDLSAVFTASTSFTTARGDMAMGISNGYMYISGGRTNTTYYSDTQYGKINSNNSITWATAPATTLTTGRYGQGSAIYNGYLYTAGGYDGTTYYNSVIYTLLNNGGPGTTASWSTSTSTGIPAGLGGFATAVSNGYIYYLGGGNTTTHFKNNYYAKLNPDGSIGNWLSTTANQDVRDSVQAQIINNYVYLMSGYTGSGDYLTTEYAPINSNGTIGTWSYTTANFTGTLGSLYARDSYGSATYNGRIYIMGGNGGSDSNEVDFGTPGANGNISAWTKTTNMPFTALIPGSAAYDGYMYLIGGNSNTVIYAPINSDGTIGTWLYSTSFNGVRYPTITAYDGYMYIIGGLINGSGLTNPSLPNNTYGDVQYAPIHANGSLGGWQNSTALPSPNYGGGQALVYNGYVYEPGAYGSTSALSSGVDYYAAINSIARVGHYSTLVDLSAASKLTSITYNGLVPSGPGAVIYRAAGSDGVFRASALTNSVTAIIGCASTTTATRYIYINATLDDSFGQGTGGAFADSNGTNANLTDFTINYTPIHPAPNIRLRTGQTLQAGNLSALDTCTP